MIRVTCGTCGAKFDTADANAGKKGKCNNCGNPITVPVASAPAVVPAAVAPPQAVVSNQAPVAPTVVIQMQQPMGALGPANKSIVLVLLLAFFTNCLQYFYLGQTGKGALFLVLDIFVWGPIIFFTCGLGLIGYIPYHLVLLIDSIVITSRLKTQAISPWRFF